MMNDDTDSICILHFTEPGICYLSLSAKKETRDTPGCPGPSTVEGLETEDDRYAPLLPNPVEDYFVCDT